MSTSVPDLTIHLVEPGELSAIIELFHREVYPDDLAAAQRHFDDHTAGGGDTFIAKIAGALAGWITIRWQSHNEAFRRANIPLIQDLCVFEQFQRRGIASLLMDAAESLIATRSDSAGIVVGLFDAYGPAQRLYARRGYVPDGRGACQAHRPLQLGEVVTMDHDLIIWMTKQLSD